MERLHNSEINKKLFKLAFENANICMCLVDLDARIFRANSMMSAVFGYSIEELEKLSVEDIAHPAYKNISPEFIKRAEHGETSGTVFTKHYLHKDGTEIICEVTSSAVRDENEEVLFFISHIQDITEQRRVEAELKSSEEKYRLLAENIADVIWVFNVSKQKFNYISNSVFNLTGFTVQEAMQQKFHENVAIESRPLFMDKKLNFLSLFLANRNEGQSIYNEVQIIRKNGELIWIETVTKLKFKANGELELIAVSRNIEDRKKSELQLAKYSGELNVLNKDKDRFLQILAHDLRNPFSTFLGLSNLLLKNIKKYSYDQIELQISSISHAATRTYKLLDDLLLWSQSQLGKLPFKPRKLILKEICEQVIALKQNQTEAKNIKIIFSETEKFQLLSDKDMLNTILRNLISNAIKFTNKNGQINIYAERCFEDVLITVADNGIGMSAESQSKLWDYARLYTTAGTEKESGSGLGLTLCKEFVERHGKKMWVESTLGEGTSVKFLMPLNTDIEK